MSIDCLAKVSIPKLRIITLYNNKISVGDNLVRGKFPCLSDFEFDKDEVQQDSMIQNIDFLFKLQSRQSIFKIYAKRYDRIKNINKIQLLE